MRIGQDVFTTGQVAEICGVAPHTVSKKWFDTGLLKGYRLPGSGDRRVPRKNLIRFMKENEIPTGHFEEDQWYKVLVIGAPAELVRALNISFNEDDGYRVSVARNWFEAGMMVENYRAQAIIFDLVLGREESIEVSLRLRKREEFEDSLFFALVNEDDSDVDILKSFGFNALFKKPFDVALLAERIISARGET